MMDFIKKSPAVSAMLASAVILLAAAAVLPAAPVWITDVGNKYIIMRNFARTGQLEIRHDVPGTFPAGGFHFQKTEKGYRSFYPEQFPVLSSYLYRFAGARGITLLPILCGVLLAGAAAYKFRSFAAGMLTLFATPCVFYSLMLWEMIPAVLAGFCGVMLLRERKFFPGGIVLGLGLFFREELYFLGAAAGAVLLFQKEWKALLRLSCGFLCGMLPVWLLQYLLTGHVLGLHGATYYLNNRTGFDLKEEILGVFWNFYQHVLRFDSASPIILPVVFLLLIAWVTGDKKVWHLKIFFCVCAGLLILYGVYNFLSGENFCYRACMSAGFICALPLCWLFWSHLKQLLFSGRRRDRFLTGVVLAYTLIVPPLLTRHDVGLFWGARHFLFVMPFAVYLSIRIAKLLPCGKMLLYALAGVSIIWQLCGLYALLKVSEESDSLTRTVLGNSKRIVASDVFFLPEQAPELFFERDFCEVTNRRQLESLLAELARRKENEVLFITSPRWSRLDKETRLLLRNQTARVGNSFAFKSAASGFMDLVFVQVFFKDQGKKSCEKLTKI